MARMSILFCKRPVVLAALGIAVFSLFVLTRTSDRVSSFSAASKVSGGQDAAARTGAQRLRQGQRWVDIDLADGPSVLSRTFRRLAGGVSPRAPPGHPYFTDDETVILEVAEEEHPHGAHAWHKPLHPIDGWDVAGVGLACIGLMIAAAGGIGGGGILVPLYILVLGFHPKHAIPLSNITIFGGAITNTVLNLSKRHPDADRPLVDWDLILVMEPLTIGGALVGSFINKARLA